MKLIEDQILRRKFGLNIDNRLCCLSTVQRFFIYRTCTTLQKKNEYKKRKKGGGNRIYNPRGLD